jgi:hypothetical protein
VGVSFFNWFFESDTIIQAFTTHMARIYLTVDMKNKVKLKTNTFINIGSTDILHR